MNTRSVNSAAGVILAAMSQNRTAAGIALALEAAGLLMSPETAADMASVSTDAVGVAEQAVVELRREHEESARLRDRLAMYDALELGGLDGRVSASCENPEHPTWLRVKDDKRVCPWCLAEMQNASLTAQRHELEKYQRIECEREANQRVDGSLAAVANLRIAELNRERDALQARVAELETERHSTNEALADVTAALRAEDTTAPDFFQPGRTYLRFVGDRQLYFRVLFVSADNPNPANSLNGGNRTAFGWARTERSLTVWGPKGETNFVGWRDVTEGGDA